MYSGVTGEGGLGWEPTQTKGASGANTPNSQPFNFDDGTSANIAYAGKEGESGALSCFLVYFKV